MVKKLTPATEGFNEILLYTTPNGQVKVEIYLQNETIWLTQQRMADLFGVERSVVTKHLKNIFQSGELSEISVSAKFAHTASDGKKPHRYHVFGLFRKPGKERHRTIYERLGVETVCVFAI